MSGAENNSKSIATDSIIQGIIEGNTETTTGTPTIVRSILGTFSRNGTVVVEQMPKEINKDKPWREVIKRRFINGGSDN